MWLSAICDPMWRSAICELLWFRANCEPMWLRALMWNYVTKCQLWIVNQGGQGPFENNEIKRPRADVWNMNDTIVNLWINRTKGLCDELLIVNPRTLSECVKFLSQGPHFDYYKPIMLSLQVVQRQTNGMITAVNIFTSILVLLFTELGSPCVMSVSVSNQPGGRS